MAKAELIKARELIAGGWVQGSLVFEGCYCLDGAVGAANLNKSSDFSYNDIRGNESALADLRYLAQYTLPKMQDEGFMPSTSLDTVLKYDTSMEVNYMFNDYEKTTQADVLALLDTAIANYPAE